MCDESRNIQSFRIDQDGMNMFRDSYFTVIALFSFFSIHSDHNSLFTQWLL